MLISLKGMGFNSVFNFLKIPFHVYFFFQSCFCFSFPCITFCPTTSSSILLILYCFNVFNLFFFLSAFKDILSFPILYYLYGLSSSTGLGFLSFPPRPGPSCWFSCFLFFSSHTLTWLFLVLSMLTLSYPTSSRACSSSLLNDVYYSPPTGFDT